MKKLLISFLFLFLLFAQKGFSRYDSSKTHFVGLNLRPLLFINDVRFHYEYQLRSDRALGIAVSYIYPNKRLEWDVVSWFNSPALFYRGASVSCYVKMIRPSGNYLSLSLKAEYKFFSERWLYMGGMSSSVNQPSYLLSIDRKILMFQSTIGRKIDLQLINLDVYLGLCLGVSLRNTDHLAMDFPNSTGPHPNPNFNPYSEKNVWMIVPGFTTGIVFGKKWQSFSPKV